VNKDVYIIALPNTRAQLLLRWQRKVAYAIISE